MLWCGPTRLPWITVQQKTGEGWRKETDTRDISGPLLWMEKRKSKENNLTVHVTCWKTPDKPALTFSVFRKYQCCVDSHRCHLKLLPLTSRTSCHLAAPLTHGGEGSRPLPPTGASPVPIFSDSPEEVTLVHWRCELVSFFLFIFGDKIIYKYIDIYRYRIMHY